MDYLKVCKPTMPIDPELFRYTKNFSFSCVDGISLRNTSINVIGYKLATITSQCIMTRNNITLYPLAISLSTVLGWKCEKDQFLEN